MQTLTITWDDVTTRADGTPLTNALDHYDVQYYTGPFSSTAVQDAGSTNTTSITITDIPNDTYGVRIRAVDDKGNVSNWSNWITGDLSEVPPATPGNIVVSVS